MRKLSSQSSAAKQIPDFQTTIEHTHTPLPARDKSEEISVSQPEVNLPASLGDSTTVTAPSTPLNSFNVEPNLSQGDIFTRT